MITIKIDFRKKMLPFLIFLIFFCFTGFVFSNQKNHRKEKTTYFKRSVIGLLEQLGREEFPKGIHINFEENINVDRNKTIVIKLDNDNDSDDSLSSILDQMASQSSYVWTRRGNVVNIFPKDTIGNSDYFFNARIKSVKINGPGMKTVMKVIREKLGEEYPGKYLSVFKGKTISEVSYSIDEKINQNGSSIDPDDAPFLINLENVSVREVLNEVAVQKNQSIWAYNAGDSGFKHYLLTFK